MTRLHTLSALIFSIAIAACSCDDDPNPPPTDGGVLPDGFVPDGFVPDGGVDGMPGCVPPATPEPTITICPGDALPAPAEGTCEVTPGSAALLITGDILTEGEVFRGGQVLVDASGGIACVGCDCGAMAAGATAIVCPDAVVSPGLINAHEHITFAQNLPYDQTPERYEHRHDWRRGLDDHQRLSSAGSANGQQMAWGELRYVLGGGTSLNGSGSTNGFLRNLDRSAMEGLGQPPVEYDTFPLGDTDGTKIEMGCAYPGTTRASEIAEHDSYTPHISEGIDPAARNEFVCVRDGDFDLIQPQTAVIHGIGLLPTEIGEMAADGSSLIWSPRSNITLYGDTARVTEYDNLGVPIALGTDWVITGSMNMLRELQCADEINRTYLADHFTDQQLWMMVTGNAAASLAVDDVLGALEPGKVADIAIFRAADGRADYRAVIDAGTADVVLVLRGGVPLYGDAAVVAALPTGETCEPLPEAMYPDGMCGVDKRICASRETGSTLSELFTANASSYPLFFCDEPDNEPSCLPTRDAMGAFPDPEVNGSNRYTGMVTADDGDGDGIPDAVDNCVCTFNPIRPLDNGMQADFDGDGAGDACDPCPLETGLSGCAPPDPTDRDGDGVTNAEDNCPNDPNPGQEDGDGDGKGDVCDACPADPNPGEAACPATIYDVKNGTFAPGSTIAIEGAVVTGVGANGFFMQVPASHPDYAGVDNSGVFVFTGTMPTVAPGEEVALTTARIQEFFGQIQLTSATVVSTGTGLAAPTPTMVTAAEVAMGGARATALDATLVTLADVAVTDAMPMPGPGDSAPTGEFEVEGGVRVDDYLYLTTPFPMVGEVIQSLTGVLNYRNEFFKVEPRDEADVVFGDPALLELSPASTFIRQGSVASPTIPDPLVVRLTRAATMPTTITLMSSSPTNLTVTDVIVPTGSREVPVPVTGVLASATPVTLTASYDGRMRTAMVRVIGVTETPELASITPATATAPTTGALTLTANLTIPAPAGGATVMLSVTGGGTVPASVTVPADALSADFTFTAPATPGTSTVTGTLGGTQMAVIEVSASLAGALVINEVDYDQPSADAMEFIELHNRSASSIDLTGVALVLINGSGMSQYRRVDLSGTLAGGGYLLVGNMMVTPPAGVMRIVIPDSSVQNGEPDGILLLDTSDNSLIDALSYEGEITAATVTGISGTYNLVEGTATSAVDMGAGSLARVPNGSDTNDAMTDWVLATTPTPGLAN